MFDIAQTLELLTPAEMAAADRLAIAAGAASLTLMKRAGRAVAEIAAQMAPAGERIAIACGPGNNGGDGFIAARRLRQKGYRVEIGLLGPRAALRGDAKQAAAAWGGRIAPLPRLAYAGAALVIDAIFGAGLARPPEGAALGAINAINAYAARGGRVLSVDVPSGLDGGTGQTPGACVQAGASVTFFRLKPGHILLPGRGLCGRLALADIGIPAEVLTTIAPKAMLNAPRLWRSAMPKLDAQSHKYSRGAVLVLSGPAHRTGAARLAARAALRAGAGLVALASPPDAAPINAAHETAVMIEPFSGLVGFRSLLADPRRNVLALGPGATPGAATLKLVEAALTVKSSAPRALVLDAGALMSFAGDAARLKALIAGSDHICVLTPHDGEFARLFGLQSEIAQRPDRLSRARAAAKYLNAIIVAKGADCVVAAPSGEAAIGYDLPPTLATAGAGDALAGFIAGLLAGAMPAFEAAAAAVWLHGACARSFGPGLIAEDLPDLLPAVLRGLNS